VADRLRRGHIGCDRQTADLGRDGLRSCTVPVEHGDRHAVMRQAVRDRAPMPPPLPAPDPPFNGTGISLA
jgi:hypothetical protein